jgi:dipeptidyl aminopeptidase/acylaminoacyl peptidase
MVQEIPRVNRRDRRPKSLGLIASTLCLWLGHGPLLPATRPAKLDDLFRIRNVTEARIAPAGDRVAYVISEVDAAKNVTRSGIWLIDAAGGMPLRLTAGPGRDESPRWSPDGRAMAFISDRDGSNQIWIIDLAGGEARKAVTVEGGTTNFGWSPDGRKIAFLAHGTEPFGAGKSGKGPEDVIVFDQAVPGRQLLILDVTSGETSRLTDDPLAVTDFSWSPDGKRIAFAAQPSPRIQDLYRTDIYTVDVETRVVRDLVKRPGIDTFPRFSPDGKQVAFLSTEGRTEWIANWYLCLVPAEGGAPRNLTPTFDEFMFTPQWSPGGCRIFFQSPAGLGNQLFSVSTESGELRPLLRGDFVWSDFSFSANAQRMAFLGTNAVTPSEVYVSSPDEFDPVRLTSTNLELQSVSLGTQEIVRWKSLDGLEIEGLLLLPPGPLAEKPYPLLTYVHGGPSGRFAAEFSPQIGSPYPVQAECYPLQVLAGLGYAVFMPNPRGSYGYGETFRKANVGDWGGGDYRDIISGIDALIERKIADPGRLGIMGRSYGGYMTAWIISQTARFKAASLGAGMSDLISFYGETDIPGYVEYYLGAVPWREADRLLKRSPVHYAQNVKTPTLILHGEKDFRVPVPQAQELYTALKRNGVPVELIIYPRQGHVSTEPKFMRDAMERNLEWFRRWIKPARPSGPAS